MHAIVLDGQVKSALAIVRSLGKRGIRVAVGAERGTAMACHSRYAAFSFTYPSPYTDTDAFLNAVEAVGVAMGGTPLVYACSDATVIPLFIERERLAASMTLIFPDKHGMEIAFDKAVTYSLARVNNIPTIPTHLPTNPDELTRIARALTYPAVVKPRKSVSYADGVYRYGSARFVHSSDELARVYQSMRERFGEAPMIQERIAGEEYGVEAIVHEGVPIGMVVHHRIRSLSPSGGAAVLKETIEPGDLETTLTGYATKLMRELRWEGPIMVEFKVDHDTKIPFLMEINGRFWGSLPLSIAAGVDMPYLFYELAAGRVAPGAPCTARPGVVTRHVLGDLRHLLTVLFANDPLRPLLYPPRLRALSAFFKLPPGTVNDVFSFDDPMPAWYEVRDAMSRLAR